MRPHPPLVTPLGGRGRAERLAAARRRLPLPEGPAGPPVDVPHRPRRHDLRDAPFAVPDPRRRPSSTPGPRWSGSSSPPCRSARSSARSSSGWVHRIQRQGLAVIVAVVVVGVRDCRIRVRRGPIADARSCASPWREGPTWSPRCSARRSSRTRVPDDLRGRLSGIHIAVVAGGPRSATPRPGSWRRRSARWSRWSPAGCSASSAWALLALLVPEFARVSRAATRRLRPQVDCGPGCARMAAAWRGTRGHHCRRSSASRKAPGSRCSRHRRASRASSRRCLPMWRSARRRAASSMSSCSSRRGDASSSGASR